MTEKKDTAIKAFEDIVNSEVHKKKRILAIRDKYEYKRNQIWKDVPLEKENDDLRILWEQTGAKKKGFVNIPRAMPIILKILDALAPNGKPVSSTYLALWCRDFGTGYIEIKDIDSLALESGFSGARATTTLNTRLKILSNEDKNGLTFIRTKKGLNGKYQSVLLLNPLLIIFLKYKELEKVRDLYSLLFDRLIDVQDSDLIKMSEFPSDRLQLIKHLLEELKSH